jgi:curved DNA-binding protein
MNHYDTLGVKQTATDKEIKNAYRKLAMKHHPDRNPGAKSSDEEFKKINEAYSVLSDSQKKKDYDFSLQYGAQSSNFNHSSDNMNDFVNSFFKQGSPFEDIFGRFSQKTQTLIVNLDFWEGCFGAKKTIEFMLSQQKMTVAIDFPPNTNTGDIFQVQAGSTLINLQVNVAGHPQFTRENLDLYTTIEIPMTTALLGGSISFVHWEKTVEINIPAGIQPHQSIRLANMGIKKDIFSGDLFLKCNVVLPKKLTKRQKELLQEFAQLEEKHKKTFGDNLKDIWNKFFKTTI